MHCPHQFNSHTHVPHKAVRVHFLLLTLTRYSGITATRTPKKLRINSMKKIAGIVQITEKQSQSDVKKDVSEKDHEMMNKLQDLVK